MSGICLITAGNICGDQIHSCGSLIIEDNFRLQPNDDINFSAPGGDFQSVLDDDMVPFEQVMKFIQNLRPEKVYWVKPNSFLLFMNVCVEYRRFFAGNETCNKPSSLSLSIILKLNPTQGISRSDD